MAERADPVFLDRAYEETLGLLVEARDYFTHADPALRRALPQEAVLRASCEALRVTSRLTHVMAWLLMQRALQAREVSERDAYGEAGALAADAVCLDDRGSLDHALPPGLRRLLDRSRSLYVRIARLDEMARGRLH